MGTAFFGTNREDREGRRKRQRGLPLCRLSRHNLGAVAIPHGCAYTSLDPQVGTGGDPMYPDKLIGYAVRYAATICFALAVLAIGLPSGAWAATPKAGKPAASAKTEATPEKIQQLKTLLADPKVRDWL